MNTDDIHNDENLFADDGSRSVFGQTKVDWPKSKADVWTELEKQLDEPKLQLPVYKKAWFRLSLAASLILFFAVTGFMYTYSETIKLGAAQELAYTLPDGSVVEMNAGSSLAFKPYWWSVKRELSFEGEGFFKVQKGEKFTVNSNLGTTSVLGTSFVIRTRDEGYRVTCFTGKVKVQSTETNSAVILHPNEAAQLRLTGQLNVEKAESMDDAKAWLEKRFVFTARPLRSVFADLALAYNVEIALPQNLPLRFTGNFEKNTDIEFVLQLICKPMQLEYEKKADSRYEIRKP